MRRQEERGLSTSLEAAILLPVLILFVGLVVMAARVAIADQQVGVAAAAAVRAASLERTVPAAESAAHAAAARVLAERGLECRTTEVSVRAEGVGRALGERSVVTADVTCRVELRDVSLPLIPGSLEVTASRSAPVDPFRGR